MSTLASLWIHMDLTHGVGGLSTNQAAGCETRWCARREFIPVC
jgi:hypothetical protein